MIDGRYSTEVGLKMARLPLWPIAAETVDTVTLPGIPVGADRHTGQFPDFDLTLTGYLTAWPPDMPQLAAWLRGKRLVMSTQPELCGIIRRVGTITPVRIGTRANDVQIPFTFEPFKYSTENRPSAPAASPAHLFCRGNYPSEPVYRLTLAEDAEFTVNGISLTITDLTGEVVVDLPRRKIYQETGGVLQVVQEQTSGAFWRMLLVPGENLLTWTSGITAVTVQQNARWL